MNGKALIVTIGAFFAVWAAALVILFGYAQSPTHGRLVTLGTLLLIAPVILLAGVGPVSLRMRGDLHKQATRLKNVEARLFKTQSLLPSNANLVATDVGKGDDAVGKDRALKNSARAAGTAALQSEPDAPAAKALLDGLKAKVAKHSVGLNRLNEETQAWLHDTEVTIVRLAVLQGTPIKKLLNDIQASNYLRNAATREAPLSALPVLREFPNSINAMTLTQARSLMSSFRRVGYLEETASIMETIADRTQKTSDVKKTEIFGSEFEMFRGDQSFQASLPHYEGPSEPATVLHFVGKALPETQTGYTLRTQYTVEAQKRKGINAVVAAQAGATKQSPDTTESYEHKGILYYSLGGPQRNTVPWDQWLVANILELASIVREVKPSILHTHSDFLNAIIAQYVGDTYGIPVINETRGFWEESWLSRKANAEQWQSFEEIGQLYGLPSAYTLRKEREVDYRSKAALVITLAEVMRDHIETLAADHAKPVKEVAVVPNAVDADAFPVTRRNAGLLTEIGIPKEATVIGYISSIVEYEGIDILVRAFFELISVRHILADHPSLATAEPSESGIRHGSQTGGNLPPKDDTVPSNIDTNYHGTVHETTTTDYSHALEKLSQQLSLIHPDLELSEVKKRSCELLDAAHQIDTRNPIHLMIVGDGPELAGLQEIAADLAIDNYTTFTGRVPHDKVLGYYGAIDLFVVPRRPSTVTELVTPLKPFEAMSTGRPCIFSDVGALAEIAEESQAAATFKAGDHHDLATTMCNLLSVPETLSRMSKKGAQWVRSARTWERNAEKYVQIYKSLGLVPSQAKLE